MSVWVETKSGEIIDVCYVGTETICGHLIREDDFKLKYGEMVVRWKSEVVDDDVASLQ